MEPEELKIDYDCEVTWVQITVTGASKLYVGAFCRPPDSDNPDYLAQLDTCLSRKPENAILTIIFNQSLQEEIVPKDWRHVNVTAIFKKGTRHDAPIIGWYPLHHFAVNYWNTSSSPRL